MMEIVQTIQSKLGSRQDLALYRIELLNAGDDADNNNKVDCQQRGFSSIFVPILHESIEKFLSVVTPPTSKKNTSQHQKQQPQQQLDDVLNELTLILKTYKRIAMLDSTLNEEIAMEGSHHGLSKIMKLDVRSLDVPSDEQLLDCVLDVQNLACEIAASSPKFPLVATPLTGDDLRARLPLIFDIAGSDGDVTVLINQVVSLRQTEQKDVGYVMWPSAVLLSKYILSNGHLLTGTRKQIVELGAGCGLVGLVAAKIIQRQQQQQKQQQECRNDDGLLSSSSSSVIVTDFNDIVVQNLIGNIQLNGLEDICQAQQYDFYRPSSLNTNDDNGDYDDDDDDDDDGLDQVDMILGSDIICQVDDAYAVASTIARRLRRGGLAVIVSADSKHRFGVEKFEDAVRGTGCLLVTVDRNVAGPNRCDGDALSGMAQTSGFVEGMSLTMYRIEKL
jgi:predicted nicotinamide N-methyase